MAIAIDIKDQVTPLLKQVSGAVRTDAMNAEVGRSVVNRLQAHFFKLDQSRSNVLGGKRTHFYSQAAKSTQFQADSDKAVVSVSGPVGFRQRLEGGTIKPVKSKYLTIPAISEAYGKRSREFSNLHVLYGRRGPVALVEANATQLKRGKKGFKSAGEVGGRVFFWLVKSVTQQADRGVLPSDEEIGKTASTAAANFLTRLLRREKA